MALHEPLWARKYSFGPLLAFMGLCGPTLPKYALLGLISLQRPNMLLWAFIGLYGLLKLAISGRNVPFVLVGFFFLKKKELKANFAVVNFSPSIVTKIRLKGGD